MHTRKAKKKKKKKKMTAKHRAPPLPLWDDRAKYKISVFWVTDLKILGSVGAHIFFWMHFEWRNAF